jgi:hypothetical protein
MSFLLELRTAGLQCPNVLTRKQLRDAADDIQKAILAVSTMPCDETMQALNSAWSHAVRIYRLADFGGDSGGGARQRLAA